MPVIDLTPSWVTALNTVASGGRALYGIKSDREAQQRQDQEREARLKLQERALELREKAFSANEEDRKREDARVKAQGELLLQRYRDVRDRARAHVRGEDVDGEEAMRPGGPTSRRVEDLRGFGQALQEQVSAGTLDPKLGSELLQQYANDEKAQEEAEFRSATVRGWNDAIRAGALTLEGSGEADPVVSAKAQQIVEGYAAGAIDYGAAQRQWDALVDDVRESNYVFRERAAAMESMAPHVQAGGLQNDPRHGALLDSLKNNGNRREYERGVIKLLDEQAALRRGDPTPEMLKTATLAERERIRARVAEEIELGLYGDAAEDTDGEARRALIERMTDAALLGSGRQAPESTRVGGTPQPAGAGVQGPADAGSAAEMRKQFLDSLLGPGPR